MGEVAQLVGYAVIWTVIVGLVAVASLLLWAWFPVRWTWIVASRRTNPRPPKIDWGSHDGFANGLNGLFGISARRKTRWFFGFVLFGPNEHIETYRTKIIRKDQPHDR